jgi:hypothetical protein
MINRRFEMALLLLVVAVLCPPGLSTAAGSPTTILQRGVKHFIKAGKNEKMVAAQLDCLPETFKLDEVISYRSGGRGKDGEITIEDKLTELKAKCKEGKLVDSKNREIKFFRIACFGNPPADYMEIEQKQQEELRRLQKQYTVIIIECNPRIQ